MYFLTVEATNICKRSMKICASQLSLSITENASYLHSNSHKVTYSHYTAKQSLIKTLLLTMKAIPVNSLFRTLIFLVWTNT